MSTDPTVAAESPPGAQVKVQFITSHADISLPENTGPILVPTHLRRYGLSSIINHLLASEKPIPFDFLIAGAFLRTSLDEYLTANGLSSESILTLEYVRSLIPPLYLASFEHDDWVSTVDVLSRSSPLPQLSSDAAGQERILSGSYDGLLRVWNMSSQILATSSSVGDGGHTSSIKAAKFISPSQVVSSGLDRTVRIWNYNESSDHFSAELEPLLELYGHTGSVDSLAVHAPTNKILSASTDHTLGIWSVNKSDNPTAPPQLLPSRRSTSARSKRRKTTSSDSTTPCRGPLALLRSHTAPVSSTVFSPSDPTVAYSVSWDHTLRTWDLVTASLVDTRTTSHPLLSLTSLPDLHLLAAGTSARHITLIDPRADVTTVSALTLRGHANAVVSLARDPESAWGLVSGSHDGTCRIWDVRSTKPSTGAVSGEVGESVYTIKREDQPDGVRKVGGEGIKVFGVCWNRELGIVSAGEDRKVQINRGKDVMASSE
ncbi:ribosome biogenesis protein ytm1 [Glutinoglossum americanum]|uniref:Ribosome biogenesis protein YTM1 n=1 Tax=Glutinoglossum americanum TaxID=1670608 RepID=A0A9P8I7D7_9PEZI|nr:ribosome biogenesis protein ytm1 [Glutinoglossum americanum]